MYKLSAALMIIVLMQSVTLSQNLAPGSKPHTDVNSEAISDLIKQLKDQRDEIEKLRSTLVEQQKVIDKLNQNYENRTVSASQNLNAAATATQTEGQGSTTSPGVEDRLTKIVNDQGKSLETVKKQLGSITIGGDIRLRYEGIFGLQDASANATNPTALGNELPSRHRGRIRARLSLTGKIGTQFDWGLRIATGSYADTISTNQTLTDFYNRKPFGLDQAYVAYRPKQLPGLSLMGGKFEKPWAYTEMTFDNDLMVEGISQSYTRDFEDSFLQNFTFTSFQLPFVERNASLSRNADNTVNNISTENSGRDLAILGAQARARFGLSKNLSFTGSAANIHFARTRQIVPSQVFGSTLQLALTTGTTRANITRDQLVSGNGNLGVSTSTNNALNPDGRFASGFNLVDLIGRLDYTKSKRFPLLLQFNMVTNTQARDVVSTSGGTTVLLPNNEDKGYWAEAQLGKAKERGDLLFNYTFMRIEKDAVFSPFNYSDISQQTDMRGHRLSLGYTVDPKVTLSFTSIFTQRANALGGPFSTTPTGSLDRTSTRIQLDTIFKF